MFRIRELSLPAVARESATLKEVFELLQDRLPAVSKSELEQLERRLVDPLASQLSLMLFGADDLRGRRLGMALLSHAPDVGFAFLDYIAARGRRNPGGVGEALYARVREASIALGARALFFECPPDDPALVSSPDLLVENRKRLKFYERLGARPILGTGYQMPVRDGELDQPYLMVDLLRPDDGLDGPWLRKVVQAILTRKYARLCPPEYVERVLETISDGPVQIRPPVFETPRPARPRPPMPDLQFGLVVNERHDIHHVRERGYVEAPARIRSIQSRLAPTGLFESLPAQEYGKDPILAVHHADLVDHLERVCTALPADKSIYPYVFPIRNRARIPRDETYAVGYFCIDTFTPLSRNAYAAARAAVDCALTAADALGPNRPVAYALVRPPGHHAERQTFGGFCYFNNAAIAAQHLRARGRVAILDVDYHHGNGQQDIFYDRDDVLTVSIHGHPSHAYPFFTGFEDEIGEGPGEGFNLNLALGESLDGAGHRLALASALERIASFDPDFLVVCLGLDTARRDPTGSWSLTPRDFEQMGRMIGELRAPTLVVQEGGYRTVSMGVSAREFFVGLASTVAT